MLEVVLSNRFRRDLKMAKKRGYNLDLLDEVVNTLANGVKLSEKYRDHELSGGFAGFRECHIQPDWLLVYRVEMDVLQLFLFRTGTHSDLF
jgi:mRNA interferase YafQ